MRTMYELRVDVRDKLPELLVRWEMEAQDMGIEGRPFADMPLETFCDRQLNSTCQSIVLACEAVQEWLYEDLTDGERCPMSALESTLLAWLKADGREEEIYRDMDHTLEDFPSEVHDCNRLLAPILDAGMAKGLEDEDLFAYTWLMMSPFLADRDLAPTEAEWQAKTVNLTLTHPGSSSRVVGQSTPTARHV